jgi:hypothetical protein
MCLVQHTPPSYIPMSFLVPPNADASIGLSVEKLQLMHARVADGMPGPWRLMWMDKEPQQRIANGHDMIRWTKFSCLFLLSECLSHVQ